MTLRAIICGALFGIAGVCSAADMTYTYTGNFFEHNDLTAEPSRMVAHFVFDFDHSPQAADNIYAIKRWDVSAAGLSFNQATPSFLPQFKFAFDGNMNIVEWYMSEANTSGWSAFSSAAGRFSNGYPAEDFITPYVNWGQYASVQGKPGVWTASAAPVPEPAAYLTLIAGLACLAGLQRRSGKRQAM